MVKQWLLSFGLVLTFSAPLAYAEELEAEPPAPEFKAPAHEAYVGLGGSDQGFALTVGGRTRGEVLCKEAEADGQGSLFSPRLRLNYGGQWGKTKFLGSPTDAPRDDADGSRLNHEYDKHTAAGWIPMRARAQLNVPHMNLDHDDSFMRASSQLYGEVGVGDRKEGTYLTLRGRLGPAVGIAADGDGRGASLGVDAGVDLELKNKSKRKHGDLELTGLFSYGQSVGQWGNMNVAGREAVFDARGTYRGWFAGINGRYDRNDVTPADRAIENRSGSTSLITGYAGRAID